MNQVLPALFAWVVTAAAVAAWSRRRWPLVRARVRNGIRRAKAEFVFEPLGEAIEVTLNLRGGDRTLRLALFGTRAPLTLKLVTLRIEPTERFTVLDAVALGVGVPPPHQLVPLTIFERARGRPPRRVFTARVPLSAKPSATSLFETSIAVSHAMQLQLDGQRLGTLTRDQDNHESAIGPAFLPRAPRLVDPPLTFTSQGTFANPLP